jgi:hypothetical protein
MVADAQPGLVFLSDQGPQFVGHPQEPELRVADHRRPARARDLFGYLIESRIAGGDRGFQGSGEGGEHVVGDIEVGVHLLDIVELLERVD